MTSVLMALTRWATHVSMAVAGVLGRARKPSVADILQLEGMKAGIASNRGSCAVKWFQALYTPPSQVDGHPKAGMR